MKKDEVFVCSERSASNMAYQNVDIKGQDLSGLSLKAPLANFEKGLFFTPRSICLIMQFLIIFMGICKESLQELLEFL